MSVFTKRRVSRALRANNSARQGAVTAKSSRAIESLEGRTMFSNVYHDLSTGSFSQNWTGTDAALGTADNWSGIPSIIGYLGDGAAMTPTATTTDPQVMTGDSANQDLVPNSTAGSTAGGVHEIPNDVVGMQGSGTAVAPYLTLHLNSAGRQDVNVSYTLRELESFTLDQKFALQYRPGSTGLWINVPAGAVNGAAGFTAAGMQNVPVNVTLPAGANNQANLQVRIITHDAAGSDTMVGVDDIVVSSIPAAAQAVGFDVTTVAVNEAAGTAQLSVKRLNGTTGTVTVDYATADGTAKAGIDYTAASGTLTFVPGDAEEFITVSILDDAAWEQAKAFTVNLTNATGADLGTPTATVTIDNDDPITGKLLSAGALSQDWTNTSLITTDDDWSGVPFILGFRGDDITTGTGVDPQTLLADGTNTPLDVNANKDNAWLTGTGINSASGGVSELDGIANPTIGLTGSGTGDAPFVLFNVDTTGVSTVDVSYDVRDIELLDDAIQPVALHYRVGSTGPWLNVPSAYIADATTAADTKVTPIFVQLGAAQGIDNKPLVQFRVMTANAVGNDEMVGIDNIVVAQTVPGPGRFTFDSSTASKNESEGTVTLRVARVGGSLGTAAVDYASAPGTATAPGDFTATSGTLTFTDGQLEAFITVPLTNDSTPEFAENFTVTLSNPTAGAILGSISTATVTITNDDHVVLNDGPLSEDWTDFTKTDVNDYWGDFLDISGYRGDGLAPAAGADPATIVAFAGTGGPVLDLNANSSVDPDAPSTAGVTRFNLENPTVALAGPGTVAGATTAPFLLFEVNTTGISGVDVSYTLRDLESIDDAVQPVALQYRIGNTGNFINVPAGYVADATTAGFGPDTNVSATISGVGGNALVQIRIIMADAVGFDEWVGVDNILIQESTAPALPAWVAPGSLATWSGGTLTVNGATTIIADPGVDQPLIVANGSAAVLTINPSSGSQVNVGGLTLSNGATATVTNSGTDRVLVVSATGGLNVSTGGKLDLTDNDMIVKGATLSGIQGLITGGFGGGTWDGAGVNSSAAATDPNATKALGYGDNAELGLTSFSGVTGLTGNEILVKYTYYGDADLTGVVDLDDYGLFLTGYQNSSLPRTWIYGDFDYTGVIDLDDFGLFLYGKDNQGGPQ